MIKTFITLILCLFLLSFVNAGAQAATPAGFEQLKSLVGNWQGKLPDGSSVMASYQLISGGTAVMEKLIPAKDEEMITIYYADKDAVMMTHYCMENNQPRMKAIESDPKTLNFSLVDITNLKSEDDGHMQKLVVTFIDHDHFNAEWTYKQRGQERPELFQFTRVK